MHYSELHRLLPIIANGPFSLRDALTAALAWADDRAQPCPTAEHIAVLREHTGGWFGGAHEVRALLKEIEDRKVTASLESTSTNEIHLSGADLRQAIVRSTIDALERGVHYLTNTQGSQRQAATALGEVIADKVTRMLADPSGEGRP